MAVEEVFFVNKTYIPGVEKWLDSVASPDKGDYGYQEAARSRPTDAAQALTPVGLHCRQALGWTPKDEGLANGVSRLHRAPPDKVDNIHYTYYATLVMTHVGGEDERKWNDSLREFLLKAQDKGENPRSPLQKGSWYFKSNQSIVESGGRVMATSMSLLALQMPSRNLLLFERKRGRVLFPDRLTSEIPSIRFRAESVLRFALESGQGPGNRMVNPSWVK
jgi:hypothetical protein